MNRSGGGLLWIQELGGFDALPILCPRLDTMSLPIVRSVFLVSAHGNLTKLPHPGPQSLGKPRFGERRRAPVNGLGSKPVRGPCRAAPMHTLGHFLALGDGAGSKASIHVPLTVL